MYLARIIGDREESVYSHTKDTAFLAERLAPDFLESTAKIAALLHDAGKNCDEFLQYLRKSAQDPKSVPRGSVTHSTAGAILVNELAGTENAHILAAEIIRHTILSHHRMRDCVKPEGKHIFPFRSERQEGMDGIRREVYGYLSGTELKTLFEQSAAELENTTEKISEFIKDKTLGSKSFYWGMLQRLILSILLDADRTASACFAKETVPKPPETPTKDFFNKMIGKLENYLLNNLSQKTANPKLTQLRREISNACKNTGEIPGQVIRLIVPTGGGKTLSSLRYALHHARNFHKRRIFYIAPFNSILEQNADVFRDALGSPGMKVILEHHSNLVPDDTEEYKELTENWGAPIVLTSSVQFLNALFSSKTGAVRRMQALTDSVIIVDEVQAIPARCTVLFNLAMNFLSAVCNTTVVLCSATQPPFEKLQKYRLLKPSDMLPDNGRYHQAFRRTCIIDKTDLIPGGMDACEAAEFSADLFQTSRSILFIVNTKKCAKDIYGELKERFRDSQSQPAIFHLSTNMCPAHRRNVMKKLKASLETEESVICISTQLIEAGVDISFQTVIRSAAGLQNIIQSAGRCNRNGETALGYVYIVRLSDSLENLSHLPEIRDAQNDLYSVIAGLQGNTLDSPEAIDAYYRYSFSRGQKKQTFCYPISAGKTIVDLLSKNRFGVNQLKRNGGKKPLLAQAFKTAGDHFQVIEEKNMIDVLVEYNDESKELIKELNAKPEKDYPPDNLLARLQPYTVSVSESLVGNLGNAVYLAENYGIRILQEQYYHAETGIDNIPTDMKFYDVSQERRKEWTTETP